MKYTKEQAEMLALLVLMGCAVVVLSFLYLVKPNFAAVAQYKSELQKTESEIATLSNATVAVAKAQKELETLTATIQRGEKAVFSGLETDPPLSEICVRAATELNLKPAYGVQTSTALLEFAEPGHDGKPVTRHYDEVSRTLDIHSADFFTLSRFLSAMEKANEGLRVTHLEISNSALSPKEQDEGKVKAKLELGMLGIREGQRSPEPIDVSGHQDFDVAQKRNPFGPPGGSLAVAKDPLRGVKDVLSRVKVTGIWSDKLIIEIQGGGSVTLNTDETFVLAGITLRYVSGSAESFVFDAVDYGKRYKLTTNWKGQVRTVTEEEAK